MTGHVGMRGSTGRTRLFAFERNAVVRAGAGTGKTEALATVYLHLVGGLASPAVWPAASIASRTKRASGVLRAARAKSSWGGVVIARIVRARAR